MGPSSQQISIVARHIAGAVGRTLDAFRQGRIEQEPAMTDRMLGAIEESIHQLNMPNIRWSAKTLTDRGPNSQESKFGADFLGALSINLPSFTVQKGFLAQAKLVKNGWVHDFATLQRQCEQMLALSSDSFVFLYEYNRIRIVPAISIAGMEFNLGRLNSLSPKQFFTQHLKCFIGDRTIKSATPDTLAELREKFQARSALLLKAELD